MTANEKLGGPVPSAVSSAAFRRSYVEQWCCLAGAYVAA